MEIELGWLRNSPEYVQKSFWSWIWPQKTIVDPETDFFNCPKSSIISFRPKLTFWVTNFKIHPVEYVHMDHTDHFDSQQKNRLDMEKRYQKNENGEQWLFEITVNMNLFCGGKFSKGPLC